MSKCKLPAKRALEQALEEVQSGRYVQRLESYQALVDIWKAQIKKAKEGDSQSATMIVDRLDGKPKQQTEHSGPDDGPIVIAEVVRTIVDPENSNS